MKKTPQAIPNKRLRAERELRGWSQKYVAEQIGADHYYLSRWERGIITPSPYYRSKLCALFGKDAKALGLLSDEDEQPDAHPETSALPAHEADTSTQAVIDDPSIPSPFTHQEDLIGRDQVLPQLREYLCTSKGPGLMALYGLPGVGKTTLAVTLAHDPAIQEHFHNGILWAGLGPHPDLPALLSRWGTLLGVAESERQKLQTLEAWAQRIRAAIGTRQMLLVIDDAWEIEHALAFKVGGPHCTYLVTTRAPGLALQFAGSGAMQIKELSEQDGVRLLARLAPQVVTDEPKTAQVLVQSVGGLPLALTLIGNYLRIQAHSGQPRRLRVAIERLRNEEQRLQLAGPQALLERSPGLPSGMSVSLNAVIEISEQLLAPEARDALRALSVFPAKPNSFSEEAALVITTARAEALDALSDAGLLEGHGPGRYTLHQTIASYAQTHLSDKAAFIRLADYFAGYVEQHQQEYDLLTLEMSNTFAALEAASNTEQHLSFVRCVNAFFQFLFTRGLHAQESGIYIERAVEFARLLNDDTLLATALLHHGTTSYKLGKYEQAEHTLQEARACAQHAGDPRLLGETLMMLGILARFRVSHDLAETYLQESLTFARQATSPKLMSEALANLGNVLSDKGFHANAETYNQEALAIAQHLGDRQAMAQIYTNLSSIAFLRGHLEQGEAYGQEALAIARDIGFHYTMSAILTNLGAMALDQKAYAKAETYLTQALDAARQIGDAKVISADLGSLGDLAARQGRYAEATAYLQESLQMARQVGDIWLISAVLAECGELALKQHQLDEAFAAFQEALTVSARGNQEAVASALYGLARVAAARGELAEAQRQGQESLRLFETMDSRVTDTVRAWLKTLPEDDTSIIEAPSVEMRSHRLNKPNQRQ